MNWNEKPVCDKCNKEFEPEQKVEKVKGDIRRVYFTCPHCGEKYTAYYLSSKIETMQKRIQKLIVKLKTYFKGTEKGDKYLAQYEELNKEIKNEMIRLRMKFED
ncbi:TPA: transglycosylase [Clostridium perfringens]|uniref:Transglycosylase n=1 Tax=Clostridium perfringens TaxID=1502 RepID=A0A8H9UV96_CLOPF|nr:transglycosylase [Clostridium perfringens]